MRPERAEDPSLQSNSSQFVGPAAYWSKLRRLGEADVLASKARSYIQQMLSETRPSQAPIR
ncbi:MAG: hypothetical protein HY319_11025 [Armatimonadetes bacterium]|nr:hypothetical protein [Armatimonadota bacterium]